MNKETEKRLARSLTAENTELIPYLPYLLQDLWSLGTPAGDIIKVIKKHISHPEKLKVLDLACGKGAVSIPMAKELGITVRGYDIIPEFIDVAKEKAEEFRVNNLCTFETEDVIKTVAREKNWDLVMFLAAGDVLGSPQETLSRLKQTIKPNGYVIIEECYAESVNKEAVRWDFEYATLEQWQEAIEKNGMRIVEKIEEDDTSLSEENDFSNRAIAQRARELCLKYPDLSDMFEGYVQSQLNECYDIENTITAALMVIQRKG